MLLKIASPASPELTGGLAPYALDREACGTAALDLPPPEAVGPLRSGDDDNGRSNAVTVGIGVGVAAGILSRIVTCALGLCRLPVDLFRHDPAGTAPAAAKLPDSPTVAELIEARRALIRRATRGHQ